MASMARSTYPTPRPAFTTCSGSYRGACHNSGHCSRSRTGCGGCGYSVADACHDAYSHAINVLLALRFDLAQNLYHLWLKDSLEAERLAGVNASAAASAILQSSLLRNGTTILLFCATRADGLHSVSLFWPPVRLNEEELPSVARIIVAGELGDESSKALLCSGRRRAATTTSVLTWAAPSRHRSHSSSASHVQLGVGLERTIRLRRVL